MFRYMLSLLLIFALAGPVKALTSDPLPPIKKITVTVTGDGEIFVGRDTVMTDGLAREIQTRLWKSYLGTGRMYDSITVTFQGEVLMGLRGSVLDAIREAQDKALELLCVDKYKKPFDRLTAVQQQKVRKQFPVLFQQLAW